ncbi:MAG: CvpA family protein [Rikenellaceae bacterium]|nr:CvpA family protein [Rikenellaceae bacterium]
MMNFFDILTLVALVWAVVSGWRSGFVSQLLGLLGIILGIVLSLRYGTAVGEMFNIDARFSVVAGFLITFVATLIIATLIARLIARVLSFVGLGWVNTLLGIVLSIVKGLIVLSMLYAAIFALNANLQFVEPQYFDNSISFDLVRKCAEPLFNYWEEAKQVILSPTPKA